jgi:hypothetical protein
MTEAQVLAVRELALGLQESKVDIKIINFPLDKNLVSWYNLHRVDKEIEVGLDFLHRRDETVSLALESQRSTTALRTTERSAQRRQVQCSGLGTAYRAMRARRACEQRLHLVRRRNLTNPVWIGLAL